MEIITIGTVPKGTIGTLIDSAIGFPRGFLPSHIRLTKKDGLRNASESGVYLRMMMPAGASFVVSIVNRKAKSLTKNILQLSTFPMSRTTPVQSIWRPVKNNRPTVLEPMRLQAIQAITIVLAIRLVPAIPLVQAA